MSAGDDDRLHVGAQVWVLGDALWQRGTVRSIDPLEVEIDGDIRSANRVELCEPNERSHVEVRDGRPRPDNDVT